MIDPRLGPIGRDAIRACVWEATARKPGNVHRWADFPDLTYLDFMISAAVIGPEMDVAPSRPVGETILASVQATRTVTRTNTNLGIVLLLAPLAAADANRNTLDTVLASLTVRDASLAYKAIRLAVPGGLGHTDEQDVADEPTVTLRAAMEQAAERDSIARQYRDGFVEVVDFGVPLIVETLQRCGGLEQAIVQCHLHWLARFPDSLIARKHGLEVAEEVSHRAGNVIRGGESVEAFDNWLRREHRNPGTTADLVAATLFVALRSGRLPVEIPW